MPVLEWKDEMIGDLPDLVETEWDVELSRRLDDVMSSHAELIDHDASMREARVRLAERNRKKAVA